MVGCRVLKSPVKAEIATVMVSCRYFVTIREGAATVARVVILAQSAADAKRQAEAIASLFPGARRAGGRPSS